MNILFVIPSLRRAGAERVVVNICNELIKNAANKVAIFLIEKENEYLSELDSRVLVDGGNTSFQLSLYKKNKIQNEKYIKFVTDFKPTVIHSHLYLADILTHSYHYDEAIYVSHIHNSTIEEYNGFSIKKLFVKRMWTNLYELSWLKRKYKEFGTNFIACSAGAEKLHSSKIGVGKSIVLPNSSPLPILATKDKSIGDVVNLIWIGRLTDVKRPQLAIKIAHELKAKGINFNLKLAGDGPEMKSCKALIEQLSLSDNVKMLGLVDDMKSVYEEGNIMIHTSVYEGLPLVFTEAISYGIPVITTDCMPDNEIIEEGVNGHIIKSEEPSDFVKVLDEIINNPQLYQSLSENAIQKSKEFGIEKFVEKMLAFYKI